MSTARRAYAAPAPVDRTRSATVRTRQGERRSARAMKLAASRPLDVEQLQAELHAQQLGVAR